MTVTHKYGQTLLSSENVAGSETAAGVLRSGEIFTAHWKLALLLGALFGMVYAAYSTLMPIKAQTDNLTTRPEEFTSRSHTASENYYWPLAHGRMGSYSNSPYSANIDIANPTWTWNYDCCFMCTWCTIPKGVTLDDKKHIYLTAHDGIRKFTPHGKLLWHYRAPSDTVAAGDTSKVAALMDGVAYTITHSALVIAVSMDTGKLLWSTQFDDTDGNDGSMGAHAGVVLVAAGAIPNPHGGGSKYLYGLNGTDGSKLWSFTPDEPLWNFGASFDNDGAVTYMDMTGRVYRQFVANGTLLWKAGGIPETWNDGQVNLGSNGIVYGVTNYQKYTSDDYEGYGKGILSAYRLSDGKILWMRNVSRPPNTMPAVGKLAGKSKPSVVMPVGHQNVKGEDIGVYAFDAETGEEQWWFQGPTQTAPTGSLDDSNAQAFAQRLYNGIAPQTMPNPWGIPAIDGDGNVFVGGITGQFYRLQDSDGDGKIAGPGEVAFLKTDAAFDGGSSPAIAPGLLAVANAHSLIVWNY